MKWTRYINHCYSTFLIMVISIISNSCVDEIELEGTGGGGGQLVVQGQLLKSRPSTVRVQISRTADFAIRSFPTAVEGAEVILEDSRGNRISINEIEPGIYEEQILDDNPDMVVQIGESYVVRVSTAEGSTYVSTPEQLNPVPEADSVSIGIVTREVLDLQDQLETKQFMQFFINTPIAIAGEEDQSRLRWTFENIYRVDETFVPGPGPGPQTCFVSRGINLDKVVVFNGNSLNSDRLNQFLIMEDEIDYRFGLGYLLRISQHSLGRQAYEYWDKVSQAVSLSGGLFEASPGEIIGNIQNINDAEEVVYGYFYVSEEQIISRFVTPDEAGRPKDFCSLDTFTGEQVCLSCVTIPDSSKDIPNDWGQ